MAYAKRVLIVDDEPLNVKLLATMLASEGYELSGHIPEKTRSKKRNKSCRI
jgi:CheY-like chemotaxis protein